MPWRGTGRLEWRAKGRPQPVLPGPRRNVDIPREYRALRSTMQNRRAFFEARKVPPSTITKVRGNLRDDGEGSWGVVLVETDAGPMALKLIHTDPDAPMTHTAGWEEMRSLDEAIIQDKLGELGLGLPVTGMLDEAGVTELLAKHPEIWAWKHRALTAPPKWGFMTPHVPDAFNPKVPRSSHEIKPLPPHARGWSPERLRAWYDQTASALDALGVRAYDFQVLITREGQPYIVDTQYLVRDVGAGHSENHRVDPFNSGELGFRRDALLGALERLPPGT